METGVAELGRADSSAQGTWVLRPEAFRFVGRGEHRLTSQLSPVTDAHTEARDKVLLSLTVHVYEMGMIMLKYW